MLRAIPHKLSGVMIMGGAILTLFFVPWLDASVTRSNRFRPLMNRFFWAFAIACILLAYCGARPADASVGGVPVVWVARLATLYYFAFFWLIMPIVGLIEVPGKVPASIAQSVLADSGQTNSRPDRLVPAKAASGPLRSAVMRPASILAWATTKRRQQ
jgi:Cytochrome b(C-terminal)/b6/petD